MDIVSLIVYGTCLKNYVMHVIFWEALLCPNTFLVHLLATLLLDSIDSVECHCTFVITHQFHLLSYEGGPISTYKPIQKKNQRSVEHWNGLTTTFAYRQVEIKLRNHKIILYINFRLISIFLIQFFSWKLQTQ